MNDRLLTDLVTLIRIGFITTVDGERARVSSIKNNRHVALLHIILGAIDTADAVNKLKEEGIVDIDYTDTSPANLALADLAAALRESIVSKEDTVGDIAARLMSNPLFVNRFEMRVPPNEETNGPSR